MEVLYRMICFDPGCIDSGSFPDSSTFFVQGSIMKKAAVHTAAFSETTNYYLFLMIFLVTILS